VKNIAIPANAKSALLVLWVFLYGQSGVRILCEPAPETRAGQPENCRETPQVCDPPLPPIAGANRRALGYDGQSLNHSCPPSMTGIGKHNRQHFKEIEHLAFAAAGID
jgi:hypothetical protein